MLTHRLNELLTEGNRTLNGMSDQGDRLPDPSDRATMESETSFTLRIRAVWCLNRIRVPGTVL